MPKDPVCGMDVNENEQSFRSDFGGQTYHFCSDKCKNSFDQEPQSYLNPEQNRKRNKKSRQKNKNQSNKPNR